MHVMQIEVPDDAFVFVARPTDDPRTLLAFLRTTTHRLQKRVTAPLPTDLWAEAIIAAFRAEPIRSTAALVLFMIEFGVPHPPSLRSWKLPQFIATSQALFATAGLRIKPYRTPTFRGYRADAVDSLTAAG